MVSEHGTGEVRLHEEVVAGGMIPYHGCQIPLLGFPCSQFMILFQQQGCPDPAPWCHWKWWLSCCREVR